ncbi:MAG: RNA pseudouridine synthase [Candidatus Omnitrophica bacterium]|nr:RNA pseudouridine synthase [Candidatus Omnitrophota bacterium]
MMTHPAAERVIPVLFEDEDCVVFDKPPGLLVIPTPRGESRTLVALADRQFSKEHLYPAHRLDRDTSGVILFAKGKNNQHKLMALFKERRVKKDYIAFVHGRIRPVQGDIRVPVKDHYSRRFKPFAPAIGALTHYCVVDYHNDFTVVDVRPATGRTNQVRIHFSEIGHPLVGEDVYALRKDFVLRFRRTALHAARLEWPLLSTGKTQAVASPLPRDMAEFLKNNP